MDFGWKILIPVSLGWFLVLAALRQFANGDNVASLRVVGIASLIGVIAVGLFAAALNVSRKNREVSSSLSPVPSSSASSKGAAN
jgi:NADH-quinone oxidoreductase subunit H